MFVLQPFAFIQSESEFVVILVSLWKEWASQRAIIRTLCRGCSFGGCSIIACHRILGIHAAQCNLGVLLCQEVKQQLLVRMATGHVVDCDSRLPIVSSLDAESLQDSQLRAD